MGRGAAGAAHPGPFLGADADRAVADVSCRYIWWRYTSTLNWNDPVSLVCGIILLFAETYAWVVLVLGYFQVVWPLNRQPVPLPEDMDLWPTVDIFVPTYNEDLNVVKNTIYASQGIDWPKDKLNIWILDDGGREAFRQFAQRCWGALYRPHQPRTRQGRQHQ